MNRRGSASAIILIVLIVISLALAGGTFYLFQKERGENQKLSTEMQDLKLSIEKTKVDLANSRKEISALELRLKDAQSQIETMGNDLQLEKASKQDALKQIDKLTVDLDQQKSSRAVLETKLNQAQDDLKKTQVRLKDLEARKSDLELKVSELETKSQDLQTKMNEIELGKIVVNPEPTPMPQQPQAKQGKVKPGKKQDPAKGPEGKILVINRDYNFVVINVGSRDGVAVGNVFGVYHGNKYLGDIKVEKIHDSMAAAGFLVPDLKDRVSETDRIVFKSK